MSDLVRLDVLLGGPKTIVGNQYLDIILQTLGKLYVLSGSAFTEITSAINSASSAKPTIVMDSISMLDPADYTGLFLYETTTKRLYLSVAGAFCLIADTDNSAADDKYILKANPEVFKPITINTASAPLKVNSMNLVSKLNADLLDGIHGDAFAQKEANEEITGRWNFKKNTVFESPTRFYRNITIDESFGSPQFMSGYNGYGWRFDATSNTLTIDNLVVRKTMHVFELVVNKITATNGSLWITNAFKVDLVHNIHAIDITRLTTALLIELLNGNTYYVFYSDTFNKETITVPKKNICSNQSAASEDGVYDCFDKVFYVGNLANLTNTTSDIITFINGLSYTYLYNEFIPSTITDYGSVEINNRSYFTDLDITPTISVITSDHISYTLEHVPLFRLRYLYKMFPYFKYFAAPKDTFNYYIVIAKEDEYPVFKIGDMIRCLKFTRNTIKYYDAVVIGYFGEYGFIILVATSETMYTSTVETDEYGNPTIKTEKTADSLDLGFNEFTQEDLDAENANRSEENKLAQSAVSKNFNLAQPEEGDSLVQIGSIMDTSRMGSLYLTSTDDLAPFMDVITEVDRPDYSVLYFTPVIKDGDYVETSTGYYKAELSVKTKVRVGKLTGIHDEKFKDKQPHGYGLYGENVFLTGEFYLNNGDSVVEFSLNGIFERYKKAGLTILDVAGETDKEEILLEADQIKFTTFDEDGNPTQAGMFDKGKFNAKYIDVGNLNAENIIATEEGNAKDVNPVTHPDKTTDSTAADYLDPNDPASYVKNTTKPYVIINGHTGKLFAKDGVFLGEIIVKGAKSSYIHLNPNAKSLTKLPSLDVYNNNGVLATSISGSSIDNTTTDLTVSFKTTGIQSIEKEVTIAPSITQVIVNTSGSYWSKVMTVQKYSYVYRAWLMYDTANNLYLTNTRQESGFFAGTLTDDNTNSTKATIKAYVNGIPNTNFTISSASLGNYKFYNTSNKATPRSTTYPVTVPDDNYYFLIEGTYSETINNNTYRYVPYVLISPKDIHGDDLEGLYITVEFNVFDKSGKLLEDNHMDLYHDSYGIPTQGNTTEDHWNDAESTFWALVNQRYPPSLYNIVITSKGPVESNNCFYFVGIYDNEMNSVVDSGDYPYDPNYVLLVFEILMKERNLSNSDTEIELSTKTLTFKFTAENFNFSVKNISHRTLIANNGISIYKDDSNYFRSYFSDTNKNLLINSFQSKGLGMTFAAGNGYWELPGNYRLPISIPILRFYFKPVTSSHDTLATITLTYPSLNTEYITTVNNIQLSDTIKYIVGNADSDIGIYVKNNYSGSKHNDVMFIMGLHGAGWTKIIGTNFSYNNITIHSTLILPSNKNELYHAAALHGELYLDNSDYCFRFILDSSDPLGLVGTIELTI